ncbi:YqiA/YcfP family alpha/beta fold hydrolase [Acinetobacter sp. WZC-1]|uniref:YqiA/YcfP family alpha/beta fold hydrolase n=1 Tax=Acinetobacter sp. WZC-1 TaxID=3459034 RepID=UPI00403D6C56
MNIIYLHGFKSSALSIKGQQLSDYCQQHTSHRVHLPDLNLPPKDVMAKVSDLMLHLDNVALLGSSLGGFYATQLVAQHNVPAVLINPVVQPWQLFCDLFGAAHMPYKVTDEWTLDHAQLEDLKQMAVPWVSNAQKILVLLQQGDEVLDYRDAQHYYGRPAHTSLIMTDMHGSHAMLDFAEKIPMLLEFLSYSSKENP